MSVQRAAEMLCGSRSAVALTGAGVSAESGIPTFRGAGGIWSQYDPVKVASIDSFLEDPSAYWKVSKERGPAVLAARPNPGHMALAALERAGHLVGVVTQNTDGLHQDAGNHRVIELHGSGRMVQCLDCGTRERRADVQARLDFEMPPRCKTCGGVFLKPTVVLFGEALTSSPSTTRFPLESMSPAVPSMTRSGSWIRTLFPIVSESSRHLLSTSPGAAELQRSIARSNLSSSCSRG